MSHVQHITDLLGLQGWEVVENGVRIEEDGVVIAIARCAGAYYQCAKCGQGFLFAYDHMPSRRIRDFPVCGRRCYLEVTPARVACPQCGIHVEDLGWAEAHQPCALRYERYVARLCQILPALDVAELEGLDKNTVYRIDRKWLAAREKLRERKPARYLGIDEIAIRKGHRYATVFYDLERREVIGITPAGPSAGPAVSCGAGAKSSASGWLRSAWICGARIATACGNTVNRRRSCSTNSTCMGI